MQASGFGEGIAALPGRPVKLWQHGWGQIGAMQVRQHSAVPCLLLCLAATLSVRRPVLARRHQN